MLGVSGLVIGINVARVVCVSVLGPLVVISLDSASVRLIFVGLGRDGVVRLAPPGVVVRSVGLLGPLIVVIGTLGSLVRSRGTIPLFTLVVALVAIVLVIGTRIGCTVGGGTVDIAVFTPGLSAPLFIVCVVPFVVRLGHVCLISGLAVGLIGF